jgi:ATP-dependent Lon protease
LPLRDIVVFPHMIVPLFVGREKSQARSKRSCATTSRSCWSRRRTRPRTIPGGSRSVLTASSPVLQLLKLPDGTVKVLVEGKARPRQASRAPTAISRRKPSVDEPVSTTREGGGGAGAHGVGQFESYVKLNKKIRPRCWSRSTRSTIPRSWPTPAITAVKIAEKQESWNPGVRQRLERCSA